MNKRLKKSGWAGLGVALLVFSSTPVRAEVNPNGQSILCQQNNWLTHMAISSPDFNIAICVDKNHSRNQDVPHFIPTHYVGQSKKGLGSIVLPLSVTGDYLGQPELYKAVNGAYTYQFHVSVRPECCTLYVPDTVTFSVFENGKKIYRYQTKKWLDGWK